MTWPISWPRGSRRRYRILWPVEANLVFAAMPKALDAKLRAAGAAYYVRRSDGLPEDQMLVRMVTSFATREEEVEHSPRSSRLTVPKRRVPSDIDAIAAESLGGHALKILFLVLKALKFRRSGAQIRREPLPARRHRRANSLGGGANVKQRWLLIAGAAAFLGCARRQCSSARGRCPAAL